MVVVVTVRDTDARRSRLRGIGASDHVEPAQVPYGLGSCSSRDVLPMSSAAAFREARLWPGESRTKSETDRGRDPHDVGDSRVLPAHSRA